MQATERFPNIDISAVAANSECFQQVHLHEQLLVLQHDVLNFCRHYLKDGDKAQEASQEVMLKAIKNISQFEHRASLKTWLLKIAYNVCSTEYQRLQNNQTRFIEFDESSTELFGDGYEEFSLRDEEPNPRLAQIVSTLSVTQQAILRYKFVDDFSLVEIASLMDAKQSSVKMNYYRALDKIHKLYVS